jgi:hypothetical protein
MKGYHDHMSILKPIELKRVMQYIPEVEVAEQYMYVLRFLK